MFRTIGFVIPMVITGLLPVLTQHPYLLHIAITIAIFSIVSLGARLVILTGQWTFGQAAFMTIGSYVSAMLTEYEVASFWVSLPLAGLAAALAATMFGFPTLRLKGSYFAIITLMLNVVIRQIILVTPGFTGGSSGLSAQIPPPDAIPIPFTDFSIVFTSKIPYYYLIWLLAIFAVLVMHKIDRSRIGSVLQAIRQSDILAQSVGINIAAYKLLAFVTACFFAGLAGSFYTHYLIIAHPDALTTWDSIYVIAYVVIGGTASVLGPVIGTLLLVGWFELLREVSSYQVVGYAIILLLVTRFLPGGLISLYPLSTKWLARLRGKNDKEAISFRKSST